MALGYGYVSTFKPPKTPKLNTGALALAAGGKTSPGNPFGLQGNRNTVGFNTAPIQRTLSTPVAPKTPLVAPPVNPTVSQQQPQAPTPGGYDLNTDPALQQIQALTGMSDEQAQAEAMKQRKQQLLAYGDQGLAQAVLGANDPTVQAAAQNPTSTLAQLKQQRDRNLRDLTEALNQQNLLYSGYRTVQEQQAAQDYENQLAGAAQGVNANLDTISGNLNAALASNEAARQQAIQDAANRALQAALANAGAGGGGGDTGGGGGGGAPAPAPAPNVATVDYNPAGILGQGTATYGTYQPYNAGSIQGAANTIADLFPSFAAAPTPKPRSSGYGSAAQRRRQAL